MKILISKAVKGMDREKVMWALENCRENCYTECPYWNGSMTDGSCMIALHDDALSLLKEQEAVEPKVSCSEQRCGNCNKIIEMDGWKACPWCGKRIDWKGWWKKNGTRNQDS